MHTWKVTSAALQVSAGPLRPHVFGARLYFRDQSGTHDISGVEQPDGTVLFGVSAAQSAVIYGKQGYLFLTTRHVLHVGSAELRWGWRYKLIQGGGALKAWDADGRPLALDGQGYFNSELMAFDQPVELSRETIVFQ